MNGIDTEAKFFEWNTITVGTLIYNHIHHIQVVEIKGELKREFFTLKVVHLLKSNITLPLGLKISCFCVDNNLHDYSLCNTEVGVPDRNDKSVFITGLPVTAAIEV